MSEQNVSYMCGRQLGGVATHAVELGKALQPEDAGLWGLQRAEQVGRAQQQLLDDGLVRQACHVAEANALSDGVAIHNSSGQSPTR